MIYNAGEFIKNKWPTSSGWLAAEWDEETAAGLCQDPEQHLPSLINKYNYINGM